ncbi:hypothetical protein Dimus_038262 [Dionaea muscipula]
MDYGQRLDKAWLVTGDFNTFLKMEEKIGHPGIDVTPCGDLSNCCLVTGLEDIFSIGPVHIWCNNRGLEEWMRVKLDRAMGNKYSFEDFESAFVCVGEPLISDHSPLLIHLRKYASPSKKSFKFLNAWADHPLFLDVVRGEWSRIVTGSPMFQVWQRLKSLRVPLKQLHKRDFSGLSERISMAKEALITVK